MATDEEIHLIRVKIGSAEASAVSDDEIIDRFAVLGSVEAVALEFLEARLGELLTESASMSVPGQISLNNTQTITSIEKRIEALGGGSTAGADAVGTVTAVRDDRCGR